MEKQTRQSLRSQREIATLHKVIKVLSKRLVDVEQKVSLITQISTKVDWLYQQLKDGMSEVLTNACHNIAKNELSAEIVYEEQTVEQQLIDLVNEGKS
ncbi:MAG: hypothetical protein COA83_09815 [Methylophaga sp.]|nr:MAG: hypothetical protein COA83_09815 [Methylophaga sp.]